MKNLQLLEEDDYLNLDFPDISADVKSVTLTAEQELDIKNNLGEEFLNGFKEKQYPYEYYLSCKDFLVESKNRLQKCIDNDPRLNTEIAKLSLVDKKVHISCTHVYPWTAEQNDFAVCMYVLYRFVDSVEKKRVIDSIHEIRQETYWNKNADDKLVKDHYSWGWEDNEWDKIISWFTDELDSSINIKGTEEWKQGYNKYMSDNLSSFD